ncbi:MAG TPA: peptide deformylase [Anaerolineae bacterium]|nr:peptide deformylase [Anaerolineae bacterium]
MSARPIVTAENPLLRRKSKRVTRFGDGLRELVSDMFDSMHAAGGLGLAAPQIGVLERVFIVEMPPEIDEDGQEISPARRYVLVNPEIVHMRGEEEMGEEEMGEEEMEEGCLSVPGFRGLVKRATSVTIKGRQLRGKPVRYQASDLLAQAFQHELDHLDGILYLDRLESADKLWRVDTHPEEVSPLR